MLVNFWVLQRALSKAIAFLPVQCQNVTKARYHFYPKLYDIFILNKSLKSKSRKGLGQSEPVVNTDEGGKCGIFYDY